MTPQFNIGDTVWFVRSGSTQVYNQCPMCFGKCALTVTLGDDSTVSIDCDCCREGIYTRGVVKEWEWRCTVESREVTKVEITGESVKYSVFEAWPDAVFATREEAEAEAEKVLAVHVAEEARRMNRLKDPKGQARTWAWNVRYHQGCIRDAQKNLNYHTAKLAVAKRKAKEPAEVA